MPSESRNKWIWAERLQPRKPPEDTFLYREIMPAPEGPMTDEEWDQFFDAMHKAREAADVAMNRYITALKEFREAQDEVLKIWHV